MGFPRPESLVDSFALDWACCLVGLASINLCDVELVWRLLALAPQGTIRVMNVAAMRAKSRHVILHWLTAFAAIGHKAYFQPH